MRSSYIEVSQFGLPGALYRLSMPGFLIGRPTSPLAGECEAILMSCSGCLNRWLIAARPVDPMRNSSRLE